jgi:hypothetical protein
MPRYVRFANVQPFEVISLTSDPGAIPGPKVIPFAIEVIIQWTLDGGKVARNVLYGGFSGAVVPTTTMANSIKAALTTGAGWTGLAAKLSTTTNLSFVTLRDVSVANQPLVPSNTAGSAGTGVGVALPHEMAIVVSLGTEKAGPGNRGRMYLPGFTTASVVVGNVIETATITAVNAWAPLISSAMSGSGLTWVLGQPARAAYTSEKTGRQFPARPAGTLPILTKTVKDPYWDSQRRRGLG